MKVIDCTPGPEEIKNIIRYLQALYKDDPRAAFHVLQAGWPNMKIGKAELLLKGQIKDIEEALAD